MTRYIDTGHLATLVRTVGIDRFLMQLAACIRADYRRWEQFDKSPRAASHSELGVIELMPIADAAHYAFKFVNGHPLNARENKLTVMAFGALADTHTGYPVLLSELTITTALRTAATSALVAEVLARPLSRSMAVIGNGAQSEFQILAFHAMLGICECRLFDTDPAATAKLVSNLAGVPGLRLVCAYSAREAVRGADIITTITADKTNATIVTPDMIEPGMHINAVGGDCPGKTELHPGVLAAARVFVEYEPQSRVEGDIQQMAPDFPVTELWQLLTGREPGRHSLDEVTVFDSVGFALEDYSALRYVNELAQLHAVGETISLVPAPGNPKDLFQFVRSEQANERMRLCQ